MAVEFRQITAAHDGWYQPGEHGDGGMRSTIYGLDTEGRVWRLDDERDSTLIEGPEDPAVTAFEHSAAS